MEDKRPILYNYKPFDVPKFGIFRITTDVYGPGGWQTREERRKIIGETDDTYVTELRGSGHGEWHGNQIVEYDYILPIGIHKSRLKEWTSGQLTLFD